MYDVSSLWNTLISEDHHYFEFSVVIGESGRLITRQGEVILFGGYAISIGQVRADGGYADSQIISIATYQRQFGGEIPTVGNCVSNELELTMFRPVGDIPKMSLVRPYARVTDGVRYSEWIPQGVFYIDTREYTRNDNGLDLMTLHCYDAMLMTEQDYPDTSHSWPYPDIDVVQEIASTIGVGVDPRTWDVMTQNYSISLPAGYSMRETLGNIASMYAGNWIMNYDGELLLVVLNGMPAETNYLTDHVGNVILFGGDKILV